MSIFSIAFVVALLAGSLALLRNGMVDGMKFRQELIESRRAARRGD